MVALPRTCVLLVLLLLYISIDISAYELQTNLGILNGAVETVQGESLYQFLNIPYAKPPIGSLRFRKPQPYGAWKGALDATRYGPSCIQDNESFVAKFIPNTNISEDCLFLNVYVPRNVARGLNKSVMVWIHGGGYTEGQAQLYDGATIAKTGDVIVVTINYRLSVFGFMTTGDSVSPGNYGLWDQILAIKWVKDNIQEFGGNPESITIFGESAGGFSVSLLALIPQNRGLFQRVIAQSGTATTSLAMMTGKPEEKFKAVARLLGCSVPSDSHEIVACLQRKSASEILHAQTDPSLVKKDGIDFSMPYGPVVDGELFTKKPIDLLMDTSSPAYQFYRSLDYITGNTNREGSLVIQSLAPFEQDFNASLGIPTSFVCNNEVSSVTELVFGKTSVNTLMNKVACDKYTSDSGAYDQAHKAMDLYGDAFMIAPSVEALDIHSRGNMQTKSYQYIFHGLDTFQSSYTQTWPWFTGSAHGSELFYLFNPRKIISLMNLSFPNSSFQLSNMMMQYWTNFAKSGNPNSLGLPVWPQYNTMDGTYLSLNVTTTAKHHIFRDRVSFWLNTLPSIKAAANTVIVG